MYGRVLLSLTKLSRRRRAGDVLGKYTQSLCYVYRIGTIRTSALVGVGVLIYRSVYTGFMHHGP
jgi:hypothetical protein